MTSPFNVNLPNLGATGVIQDPGLGGVLGQQYNNLAAAIQAMQQQERQRAQEALNEKYINAQIEHLAELERQRQAGAKAEASQNQASGMVLGAIAPQTTDLGTQVPLRPSSSGFGIQGAVQPSQEPYDLGSVTTRKTLDQALAEIPAQYRAGASEKALPIERELVKGDKERRDNALRQRALKRLPPSVAQAANVLMDLGGGDLPPGVVNNLFERLSGVNPDQANAANTLFNGGVISAGQYLGMLGIPAPEGVNLDATKERAPDAFSRLIFANSLEREFGVPGDFEQKKLQAARIVIPAIDQLERIPPASRAALKLMTTGFSTFNEFVTKANAPPELKVWFGAMKRFMSPILRDETGAAFGELEPMDVIDRFVDFDSDPSDERQNKWAARREIARSMLGAGGRAVSDQLRRGTLDQSQVEAWNRILNATRPPNNPYR